MSDTRDLEAGLAAAFGGAQSVLARLDPSGGLAQRVALLPETGEIAGPPQGAEGRYQVIGEIARGGVGVVMKGRDVDLGRDVAMKVLRDEHTGNADVLQRFVEEAQIGGQLQHPGIVPVYELGLQRDQRPFFTMKLVKGRTLAALLSERPALDHDRRRFLTVFHSVCQTMAYAHSRGVLHRDLKPANVMVGPFGEVLVVDWGMGKILGRPSDGPRAPQQSVIATVRSGSGSAPSLLGSVLGTPAYMPPEQARGETDRVDERADVFALGAMLCEVLTGKPPYVGDELAKAARADLGEAHARLAGAEPELADLCRRCLAPASPARPRNAAEVASEMARHFASIDERARGAQLAAAASRTRALGERRRRWLAVALAGSIVALLACAGGVWWWMEGGRRGREARVAAAVNEAIHEAVMAEGGGRWEEATAAAGRAVALADAHMRPRATECLARVEGLARAAEEARVAESRDRALLAALDHVRATEVDVAQLEVKDGWYADAFRSWGLDFDALPPERVVAAIRARPIAPEVALAIDYWMSIAPEGRRASLRAIADAIDADPWRVRLRHAESVAECVNLSEEALREERPVESLDLLARLLMRQGDAAKAVELLRAAWRRKPQDYWVNMDLAWALLQREEPDHREVIRFATAAVALRPDNARGWSILGGSHNATHERSSAFACLHRALELSPNLSAAHANLAQVLRDTPETRAEAVWHGEEAVRLSPGLAEKHFSLGIALRRAGRPREAIAAYREALAIRPAFVEARRNMARALGDIGDHAAADEAMREAMRMGPASAQTWVALGQVHQAAGDLPKAISIAREALALHPADLGLHLLLSGLCCTTGDGAGAIAYGRRAVELAPASEEAYAFLGSALIDNGELAEAEETLRESISLGAEDAITHLNHSAALDGLGRHTEALAALRRLEALRLALPANCDLPALLARQGYLALLEPRLPGVAEGSDTATDVNELMEFASMAYRQQRYDWAARLWGGLVERDAARSGDAALCYRSCAASAAALAGDGRGRVPVRPVARAAWRRRAVAWLREELDLWAARPVTDAPLAAQDLQAWKASPDLASLRDRINFLPPDERDPCRALWAAVDKLLERS